MKRILSLIFVFAFQIGCTVTDPEVMELLQGLKAQNDKLLEEITSMKGQLTALDGKYQVILAGLADNKKELEALKSQMDGLKTQIASQLVKLNQLIAQLEVQGADLEKLSAEIVKVKASIEELKALMEELLAGKSPIPTNGLVAWYPFNGNANDESGKENNGTVFGATLTSDRNEDANSAYFFSGQNCSTYISGNMNTSSINEKEEYSISVWVFNTGNGCMIHPRLLEFYSVSAGGLQFNWDVAGSNFLMIETINKTGAYQNTSFNYQGWRNNWINLVFTVKSGEAKSYLNGVLRTTFQFLGKPNLTSNFSFGRMNHPAWNTMTGSLDDIAIWNRVLTAEEISKIYKGEKF